MLAIDQIVPIGDDVIEWASGMAERHAAIHAAGGLKLDFLRRELLIHLEPIVNALRHRAARRRLARVFQESGDLTHAKPLPSQRLPRRACTPSGKPSRTWATAS